VPRDEEGTGATAHVVASTGAGPGAGPRGPVLALLVLVHV
jgi:hypothetical protein